MKNEKEMLEELTELRTYFELKEYRPKILTNNFGIVLYHTTIKKVTMCDMTGWLCNDRIYFEANIMDNQSQDIIIYGTEKPEQIKYDNMVFDFINNIIVFNFHPSGPYRKAIFFLAYSFNKEDQSYYENFDIDDDLLKEMDYVKKWIF